MKQVLTILASILWAATSFAQCAKTSGVKEEYKQAESVIIATVESAQPVPQSWDTLDGTNYLVRIDQRVKGKPSGEMTIFSEHSALEFKLEVGEQYLLFLDETYQHWKVMPCGNSGVLTDEGPVIKQLAHMMGND